MVPGSLDYETTSQFKLTVTISDSRGLTAVQVVTVNIQDVNEAPVIQNLPGSVTITEDVAGNMAVFTVITIDQDGDGITYTMAPSSDPFDINAAGEYYTY